MIKLSSKWDWVDTSAEGFQDALRLILETDKNLFILGAGGTGKSVLLQIAFDYYENALVMGPTGISAANLSTEGVPATTIHSALKIPPVSVFNSVNLSQDTQKLLSMTRLILIDEVSMVNASLMDYILRIIKKSSPYQTPRIILFGDLFQLPPVRSDDNKVVSDYFKGQYDDNYFFFNARLYSRYKFRLVTLERIYRQDNPTFKDVLNRIRLGVCSQEDLDMINTRVIANKEEFISAHPFMLYLATTNRLVNKLNLKYSSQSRFSEKQSYRATIKGKFDLKAHRGLDTCITIAKGQQVMCTGNNKLGGYQNGTLGLVKEVFEKSVLIEKQNGEQVYVQRQDYDTYEYRADAISGKVIYDVVGSCNQIACKPAFAVTFHKCQGLTLDSIYIDLSSYFIPESGIYLALSRCKTLEGIGLSRPITMDDIKVNADSIEFIANNMN